jgi:hypothetical protein
MKLLDRDTFRNSVFERDKDKCVVCGADGKDAHHILERRLFSNGGYYLENGATLCGECHIKAETTELSCDLIRERAGISKVCLPEDLYRDNTYDKWGNIILDDGSRTIGPLFYDESVQKILKLGPNFNRFIKRVKYPRTYHLPWSEGRTQDDKTLSNCDHFVGKRVIITEKMDGEAASLYSDYYHARSIDGRNHWSRSWIKAFHASIAHNIPAGWRVCGENLYAKHSIGYDNLESYFLAFSIWNDKNICLNWDESLEYFELLGLKHPRVLYDGDWNEDFVKSLYPFLDRSKIEGYVVRIADSFPYLDFSKSVAKFVRREHVGTSNHWMFTASETNLLK